MGRRSANEPVEKLRTQGIASLHVARNAVFPVIWRAAILCRRGSKAFFDSLNSAVHLNRMIVPPSGIYSK